MSQPEKAKTMAEQADRHILYQEAVQDPETEVENFTKFYMDIRGKKPLSMKEDFCGTGYLATEWAKSDPKRSAWGVDYDRETVEWGLKHNVEPAGSDVAERVKLIVDDVRNVTEPKVDITCGLNFSYCIFETRDELREYFAKAREGLKDDGMLILDMFGGTECYDELEEETELEDNDATYIWEHVSFNPINNHVECAIHFEFPDGSRLEKAFTYAWRFWSLIEIRELLQEAGYSKVRVFWEKFEEDEEDDEFMEGTGEYYEATEVENQESWMVYIVAEK
ncbi:MAG: class I SAM-dependent methyltransferase [Gammaproteobacteria bacterium]|nr:class I SAM-dependent methyltransferase [Gammaproteobacteria bacterium]MDH5651588.1 class I SAM-dependent methyltransferase [Gammaproteobacteria bacterium]